MMEIVFLVSDEMDIGYEEDFYQEIAEVTFEKAGVEFDEAEVSLVITSDEDIRSMNAEYRDKDYATDVLSFPMSDTAFTDGGMLGDIVISSETATAQAEESDISLEREFAFLLIHGLLHLIGFDHELSDEDEEEMFDLQENILEILIDKGIVD